MKFLILFSALLLSAVAQADTFKLICSNNDNINLEVESAEVGKFTYKLSINKTDLMGEAKGISTKEPSPSLGFIYIEELKGGFSWWMTKTEQDNSILHLPLLMKEPMMLECFVE